MAKFKEKIKARESRQEGQSIKEIAKKLKVSKGTVSIWCRDIQLTKKQIARLDQQMIKGAYKGRLKGAETLKKKYSQRVRKLKKEGLKEIQKLRKRDLFIMGIGLYWGEGSKTGCAIRFHNSDPYIIQFMMKWFRTFFKTYDKDFAMYITINEIHRKRLDKVTKYWSNITKIPKDQFRKPNLVKAKNKKIYLNFEKHYGTLCIRINKSSDLFYRMQGYMENVR